MEPLSKEMLIAPCGMNCGLCMAYLRTKNHCPGCRAAHNSRYKSIQHCIIRNCTKLDSDFCMDCDGFPCARMKNLDKRYRTKYHMSMSANLNLIKDKGIQHFLSEESEKWTCPECGGTINVHRDVCSACGKYFPELPLI